jgi:hypothetical protein
VRRFSSPANRVEDLMRGRNTANTSSKAMLARNATFARGELPCGGGEPAATQENGHLGGASPLRIAGKTRCHLATSFPGAGIEPWQMAMAEPGAGIGSDYRQHHVPVPGSILVSQPRLIPVPGRGLVRRRLRLPAPGGANARGSEAALFPDVVESGCDQHPAGPVLELLGRSVGKASFGVRRKRSELQAKQLREQSALPFRPALDADLLSVFMKLAGEMLFGAHRELLQVKPVADLHQLVRHCEPYCVATFGRMDSPR